MLHEDMNGGQKIHNDENIGETSHKKKKKKGSSKSVVDESICMEENDG